MRRTRKIGFALVASALIVGPMSATVANATTPTLLPPVFSDNFETPATASLTQTPLSGDANWTTPGSGYIFNTFGSLTSDNQTQVLGFGLRTEGGDAVSIPVAVDATHVYNLSTGYATDGDDGFIGVQQYDASDNFLGAQWVLGGVNSPGYGQIDTLPNVNSWGTYDADFTPVAGTAYVRIMVEDFDLSPFPAGYGPGAYFDNIALSEYNSAPSVTNHTVSTNEDTPLSIDLSSGASDPDSDALTYSILSGPSHGFLGAITAGSVLYTPDANYNNTSSTPDTFTFKATDPFGADSNTGTVSIEVKPVQDPSTVTNTMPSQGAFTNKNHTVVFHALVTSTDPACTIGRPVTFQVAGAGSPSNQTALTDASGYASAKYAVTLDTSYTVTTSVEPTAACGGDSDQDVYSFSAKPVK